MGAVPDAQAFREKLAALRGGRAVVPASSVAPAIPRPPVPRVELVGGREEETPFGPCYLIERRYPLTERHGPSPLGALLTIPPALLAALGGDPRLSAIGHERLLLLDTETTGLSGGTGTHVFLVGLGFLERAPDGAAAFVVRQYFLRQLGEERALLHALSLALDAGEALVTFNGKSFDWPLLATRFTMTRLPARSARRDWPHLDLLHPARRIWKHRLGSCSLGALERAVLGVVREGDIPGALIPDLYFRYLRDGDHRPLLPVLAHNAADLVSLLALLIHLGQLLTDDEQGDRPARLPLAGADHYGLATLHGALGQHDASIVVYRTALADPALPPPLRRAARLALAGALKRARRWDEAVVVWREAMRAEARRKHPDPWAYCELAKYQEHVVRDYAAAIATVEAALALLALGGLALGRDELHYRLARLRRKAAGRVAAADDDWEE